MNPLYKSVAERAGHICEYCRAPESVFNFPLTGAQASPLALSALARKKSSPDLYLNFIETLFRLETSLIASADACAPVRIIY